MPEGSNLKSLFFECFGPDGAASKFVDKSLSQITNANHGKFNENEEV
jgi:hypothetical protein